jgi:hypothetical protein
MRKYSKLAIVFSHTSPDEVESGTTIQLTNGTDTIEVSDFATALKLLPPGSEVMVIARGTVGNNTVHNISRIINESSLFVFLDLSEVTECSHVENSPFEGNTHLSSISFPNNLISINPRAFAGCTALESVYIPSKCIKIGEQAFAGCKKLKHLEFSDCTGWHLNGVPVDDLGAPSKNPEKFTIPKGSYYSKMIEKN